VREVWLAALLQRETEREPEKAELEKVPAAQEPQGRRLMAVVSEKEAVSTLTLASGQEMSAPAASKVTVKVSFN